MRGLARLGHDVYSFEDSDDYPSCYDPQRHVTTADPTYGLAFAKRAFQCIDASEKWVYFDAHTQQWHGPLAGQALEICMTADLLINISGANPLRPWLKDVPSRVLIDTDPVFTQIRNLTESAERERALQHTNFLSFGENIGHALSSAPDDGFSWLETRQPIALDAWPSSPGPRNAAYTTVMQWDSYRTREYEGQLYAMKSKSFTPYVDLPRKVEASLEIALGSSNAPRNELLNFGWKLQDPLAITHTIESYQRYIQQSKAEFSVAKHGYVVSQSGWFSERSANYLASGRPVVVQDTGFTQWMETGAGVLAFRTLEEAIAAIEEVNRRYAFHCKAAREVAEHYFDAHQVLKDLLETAV